MDTGKKDYTVLFDYGNAADSLSIKLLRFRERLIDIYYEVKWWFQRRIRGYSDCDVWNVSCALADYAARLLREFIKDDPISYPSPVPAFSSEDWKATLYEILWGLERVDDTQGIAAEELRAITSMEEEERWYRRRERSLQMLGYWWMNLWN